MKITGNTHLPTSFSPLRRSFFCLFVILTVCGLLSACIFSDNIAPTIDRTRISATKVDTHTVKAGETLYAIAWRYGLDYRALARANNIDNGFLIYIGQTLKLSEKSSTRPSSKPSSTQRSVTKAVTRSSTKAPNSSTKSQASKNVSRSSSATRKSKVATTSRSEKKPSRSQAVATSKLPSSSIKWRWPISGEVVTNFSTGKRENKGIDIKGKKGDSVRAAANGKIVYAGSGLRGYGKLVIVKHNDTYLSAYAHNDRIRVKEGQIVKAGQHIADIGSSGSRTDSVKLHFEIRRNGQPIDPLRVLPKRKT